MEKGKKEIRKMKLDEAEDMNKITVWDVCVVVYVYMMWAFRCVFIYGWEWKWVKTLGS